MASTSTSKTVAPRKPKASKPAAASVNPTLKTTTKKSLDSMSVAHRAKIERWEPMLSALGAQHVWASSPRAVKGSFYLAIKVGPKSYSIVSFDTNKPTVKAKVLVKGITSPKAALSAFGEYRSMAKAERDASRKPATKTAASKPATKTVRKPRAAKAS